MKIASATHLPHLAISGLEWRRWIAWGQYGRSPISGYSTKAAPCKCCPRVFLSQEPCLGQAWGAIPLADILQYSARQISLYQVVVFHHGGTTLELNESLIAPHLYDTMAGHSLSPAEALICTDLTSPSQRHSRSTWMLPGNTSPHLNAAAWFERFM